MIKKSMKKIFVTKQGGIGDVILATPILKALKELYPESYITFLVFDNAKDIVAGLPFIDDVFCYNKKRDGFFCLWRKMLGYDAAIFLDLTYRPAVAAKLAGVPIRVGIEHKRKIWLTKGVKWQPQMDFTYESYVMGKIAEEALEIEIPRENLNKLYVNEGNEQDCAEVAKLLQANGIKPGEKYIASSPITTSNLKNWPLERWSDLYRRIYDNFGMRTVIFGVEPMNFSWDNEVVVNLWGKLNLRQVVEIIKNSSLVVNSCAMSIHIAAATDTPSVVIYGPTAPERWAPRNKCETVVTPLSCSPCDGYHGSTCTEPKCMKMITVEEVYATCERQLEKYLHEA